MTDRVVMVEWHDAESDPNWLDKDSIAKLKAPVARSYGVIVRRDKHVLVLAHSIVGQDYGVNIIPAGMVKSVKRLR